MPTDTRWDTAVGLVRDWRQQAACRAADPEVFFPVGTGGAARYQVVAAKAVCQGCPVRDACLWWAIRAGMDAGIWGGATADERRVLARSLTTSPQLSTRTAGRDGTHGWH